jgi:hypothetical protein
MTFRSILKFTLTFTVALGLGIGTVAAQDYTTGTVEGIVQDESGAIVPGATVSITSDRGVRRSAITDNEGFFRAPRLPIGAYTVNVSAVGYNDLVDQQIQVNIGDSASFFFTLESTAGVMEEVFVTGTRRGTWDFTSTTTGISVDVVELAEKFPVQRNLTDIALFAPGTQQGDLAFGNLASFSGGSVAENAYYINGMNVTNFRNFTGSSVVPFEFYQQVEVKTGGYQAEFGRSIGGFTNSVTKSGSNELHGGIYMVYSPDYLRKERIDIESTGAWNSFDEDDTFEIIGEVSGPIIKDRLFFYALYNMRDLQQVDYTRSRRIETDDSDPFWGFKIDWVPFDGHQFEVTAWTDETIVKSTQYQFNSDGLPREEVDGSEVGPKVGEGFVHNGGRNEIYKYTGVFSDWFTFSAMYGVNRFERTQQSTTDANPVIFERITFANSSTTIGDWTNTFVNQGRDKREAWRVDADFYFNFIGDHHVRVGYDQEDLTAIEQQSLSGGEYFRYHLCRDPSGCFDGQLAEGEEYVRHLIIDNGGEFKVEQSALYIQDSWEFSENWRLNVGLRNETFNNKNANGESFIKVDDQLAPRVGLIWDPTGDGTNRVTAFYGRYYMPIAANTNIRMSGAETFIEEYLRHNGFAARTPGIDTPTGVDYANPLQYTLIGDGEIPDPATIKDESIDPLYSDEYILGYEHVFQNEWVVGVRAMYRELGKQIDDVGVNPAIFAWALENGYAEEDVEFLISLAEPIHYVLTNPGTDMRVATDTLTDDGSLVYMDLTAEQLGYDKPKRKYKALEFTFNRPFDGVWDLNGSYTYSTVRGNTEGVVKSDNGQDDAGLTQDFDLVGVMLNADGPLPTENEHRFKIWGSYQPVDWMRVGGRAIVQSPRKFGCIGVLPTGTFSDPRRNVYEGRYNDDYWFCGGQPTPRGSQLESDWLTQLDLSLTLIPAFAEKMPGQFQFRIDVFNVFDSSNSTDLDEQGENFEGEGVGSPSEFYGTPTAYQTPRRISLVAQWKF